MAEKNLVCDGAICLCNFGSLPDKLKVLTQQKDYINEKSPSKKLIATDKEIGTTFEKNTFGPCKMQPIPGGFKPCQAVVTEWKGFYDAAVISNGGHVLLEDSRATCPIGGPGCIAIQFHGQVAVLSPNNIKKSKEQVIDQLYPFGNLTAEKNYTQIIKEN